MLLNIRDFIRQQQVVSTQQLMREFNLDELALNPMLGLWLSKGVIRVCEDKAACHSCRGCNKQPLMYYQFVM